MRSARPSFADLGSIEIHLLQSRRSAGQVTSEFQGSWGGRCAGRIFGKITLYKRSGAAYQRMIKKGAIFCAE